MYERTVGRGGALRATSDLYWAGRRSEMHLQRGSCLQLGRDKMRDCIDARQLRARCAVLLLPGIGHDLHQRVVHWRRRLGVVLHERLCSWGDTVSFEYEPSDLRCRGQRLHRRHHLDLHQRSVQRRGWRGIVLHQRLHGWGDPVSVEHQPSDMRHRGQRLHR